MKNTELSSMTNAELAEKLASLKSELFNLRFTHATGSLTNNNELRICKRNIAKVKTVIRQRELGLAKAPQEVKKSKPAKAEKPAKAGKETKAEKPEKSKTETSAKVEKTQKTTKKSAKVDAEAKG